MRPPAAVLAGIVLVATVLSAAGCGESRSPGAAQTLAVASTPPTTSPAPRTSVGTPARTTSKSPAATSRSPRRGAAASVVARIDASSDRIVAEGKLHIAAGAPSNTEIRREIEIARKAGIRLPSGDSVSSFESQAEATGPAAETEVPATVWNPHAKPIADWIVPVLEWAYQHGWRGVVTSGYRSFYEQAQLNAAGAFSAPAGLSNHETTRYPGGAVDVTEPSRLIEVLRGYTGPLKLVGGVLGPIDPEHFSATGD
jgi:hypothetical protein